MSDTVTEMGARPEVVSNFCRQLSGVGRILEDPDYNVWGCAPIYGPDGKVHVFYSRWPNAADHGGWITCCEIAHAIADDPAGPYETVGVALVGRGGDWWDAMTCHNPSIYKVGDTYALFYMGGCDGTVYTKRVGVAVSDSLYGPWERCDNPIIPPGNNRSDWDSLSSSNPALVQPEGQKMSLYYKAMSIADWERDIELGDWRNANRRYGLAMADDLLGPWEKVGDGPLIDLRDHVEYAQSEDAYIWQEKGVFKMILRDMGYWNHEYGLYFESPDGMAWSDPEIAYFDAPQYFEEAPNGLDREGRFERPQLLMRDGRPDYLFVAFRGGKYSTSSGAVLKVGESIAAG